MKVSLNWAQHYSNVDIKSAGVDEIVRRIGAQLGAVEEVIDFGSRYRDIVVVKVSSCVKHPNADKLSFCRVDDGGAVKNVERGDDGLVQVVCGAPNVREGMTVAWIPPGATVPSTVGKDPFVIEAREIRGEVSNGMLASASELGVSDDHSGLLELNIDELAKGTEAGTSFKDALWLDGEAIIDCENKMFTHRPDCFGILGVARELAGIQGLKFQSPGWYINPVAPATSDSLPLEVRVEDPGLVPRFMAVAMGGVKVKPSPVHIQLDLKRVGMKPINNIVDLTNYYAHLTGQPMHAYDYDKVKALSGGIPTLVARVAKKGDSAKLLNGKTVEFEAPAVVIATDKQAIGLGGVMGGSDTEVDENTKNIIIECATFDMYNIRRTSMKCGLFTDAVTRFTKGQSIYQNDRVLYKIVADIVEQGGKVASEYFDVRGDLPEKKKVKVSTKFINDRLGSSLKSEEIKKLLENVEFAVDVSGDELTIEHPFWRTDIEIPEDIVEEVGRLHGFDKLPVELPRKQIEPASINDNLELKAKLRRTLSAAGVNELLTYSFVHGNLIDKSGQDKTEAFELSNALSPDLQYYRLSLMPSLLDKVHANVKAGHDKFAIFEIGKVHNKKEMGEDSLPNAGERIAFVFSADEKTAKVEYQGAPYYQARLYLQYLLGRQGFTCKYQPIDEEVGTGFDMQMIAPFKSGRAAYIVNKEGKRLGVIGEFSPSVRRGFKLPDFSAGFELDTKVLLELSGPSSYQPLNKFPSTSQDITLKVSRDLSYQQVFEGVWDVLSRAENTRGYISNLSAIDIFQSDEDYKNITFRIGVLHPNRTLVTEEVNSLVKEIASELKSKLDADRV